MSLTQDVQARSVATVSAFNFPWSVSQTSLPNISWAAFLTAWHASIAKPAAKELCRSEIITMESANRRKRGEEAARLKQINGERALNNQPRLRPKVPKRVWDSVDDTFNLPYYTHSLKFTQNPPVSKGDRSNGCRVLSNGIDN